MAEGGGAAAGEGDGDDQDAADGVRFAEKMV